MFDPFFIYPAETHYDDLDGQMILHHPRYLLFVERAQQAWLEQVLQAPRFDWRNFPDMYLVVRSLEIEYLRSIDGVMPFVVKLWCMEVRAAVWKVGFQICSADQAIVYAMGSRTNCKVDLHTHEPTLWSASFFDRFSDLKRAADEQLQKVPLPQRRKR
ncbi:MAG: hypothetical protein LR015_13395 [Verrucomicrobia bacterium]|nr:hypothetical protein [Verrucomicrobiota bacterium]